MADANLPSSASQKAMRTRLLFRHYAKWIDGADSGQEACKLNGVFGANTRHQRQQAN